MSTTITLEEAIKQLEYDKAMCLFNSMTGEEEPMNEDCRKSAEADELAIKALKKQIPMKPKKIDWCSAFKPCAYICPTCGVMLDEPSRENRIPKWKNDVLFCDGCGQAIDWSGYETN